MKLRESLLAKIKEPKELGYQINIWGIYGESTLLLFYQDFTINTSVLDKLLDYRALADKLVIALPKGTPQALLFESANLQVVDAIVLFEDATALAQQIDQAQLAFEEVPQAGLSAEDQKRVITL